ncbi:MAG: hypothetical protein IPH36_09450 [Saprospiraceae bacterium]|nr:hypothetical protein [Saprospiraceae bacterium]
MEAQLAIDEQALLTAENNYTIAKMQMRQLMLIDQDIDVEMPGSIEMMTDPMLVEFDETSWRPFLPNVPSPRANTGSKVQTWA